MLTFEWTSIIKQLRNYPCVFDYTMDNEDVALHNPLAGNMYAIAKANDPTRFVNTADGVFKDATAHEPNRVDFRSFGFDLRHLPVNTPRWSEIKGNPPAPVIDHEMGNFVSWPLLDDQISRFVDNIKPYWLTPARDKLASEAGGKLLAENAQWTAASNKLFMYVCTPLEYD